jgi:hypothetical protein
VRTVTVDEIDVDPRGGHRLLLAFVLEMPADTTGCG